MASSKVREHFPQNALTPDYNYKFWEIPKTALPTAPTCVGDFASVGLRGLGGAELSMEVSAQTGPGAVQSRQGV